MPVGWYIPPADREPVRFPTDSARAKKGALTHTTMNLTLKLNCNPQRQPKSPSDGARVRPCLAIFGALCLIMLLNGCASAGTFEGQDQYSYNPTTGYPGVGCRTWGRF